MKNYKKLTLLFILLACFTRTPIASEENYDTFYKKIKYEVSLDYTLWAGKDWWSKIEPYNLYLGGLPLNDQNHLEQIKKLGVTQIISLVENFELEDGTRHQPVKAFEWNQESISTTQIQAVDFYPLTQAQLHEGIETLEQLLLKDHTVYIHCKAGVGRSASIVVAFLMKNNHLTLEEALTFAKQYRPHINLNAGQQQAISEYFQANDEINETDIEIENSYFLDAKEMTEAKLAETLDSMLHYVIEGFSYESDLYPEFMTGWMPGVTAESTLARRDRYLREHHGNQDAAVQAAIEKNRSLSVRWKTIVAGYIPVVGIPTNFSLTLWHQMREATLIAALYGHELNDATKIQILECLIQAKVGKFPEKTVTALTKEVAKTIFINAGFNSVTKYTGIFISGKIAGDLFNYFSGNVSKISTYAIKTFGGDNALPISPEEYGG